VDILHTIVSDNATKERFIFLGKFYWQGQISYWERTVLAGQQFLIQLAFRNKMLDAKDLLSFVGLVVGLSDLDDICWVYS
jgi:hypothetical protein